MKDWCTWFPDIYFGVYIGDCCHIHDDTCSSRKFFNCLRKKVGYFSAVYITAGGALGCWVKYTSKMFRKV